MHNQKLVNPCSSLSTFSKDQSFFNILVWKPKGHKSGRTIDIQVDTKALTMELEMGDFISIILEKT